MRKIEGIILDWAGTAVDYGCFAPVRAFKEIFKEADVEPTDEEVRAPMGMLKRDHIREMLSMERISALWREKYGHLPTENDVDHLYARFEPILFSCLKEYCAPKPGVLNVVRGLRERGIKIGSTTGYTDAMMQVVTQEAAQLGYAPDCWISPNAVGGVGRPYPYMIFRNMERLKLSSVRNVIKIGDTASDIAEAKNAAIWAVGVVRGSSAMGLTQIEYEALTEEQRAEHSRRVTEMYRKAGADFVIEDLAEIFAVIEKIEAMEK